MRVGGGEGSDKTDSNKQAVVGASPGSQTDGRTHTHNLERPHQNDAPDDAAESSADGRQGDGRRTGGRMGGMGGMGGRASSH